MFFFSFYFSQKTVLNIACKNSPKDIIHMKCQALYSVKSLKKKQQNFKEPFKIVKDNILKYFFFIFQRKWSSIFHV